MGKKAKKILKGIKLKERILLIWKYISTGGFRSDTAFEVWQNLSERIKNIELSGTKYSSENIAK